MARLISETFPPLRLVPLLKSKKREEEQTPDWGWRDGTDGAGCTGEPFRHLSARLCYPLCASTLSLFLSFSLYVFRPLSASPFLLAFLSDFLFLARCCCLFSSSLFLSFFLIFSAIHSLCIIGGSPDSSVIFTYFFSSVTAIIVAASVFLFSTLHHLHCFFLFIIHRYLSLLFYVIIVIFIFWAYILLFSLLFFI